MSFNKLLKQIKKWDYDNFNKFEFYMKLSNILLYFSCHKCARNNKIYVDIFDVNTLEKKGFSDLKQLQYILNNIVRK
jgi:hypothetical protein